MARRKPELEPFAAWLRRALHQAGWRDDVRGAGLSQHAPHLRISVPALASLLRAQSRPSVLTIEAMAAYFGATRAEIEALLPSGPSPDRNNQHPAGTVEPLAVAPVRIPILPQEGGAGEGVAMLDLDTLLVAPDVADAATTVRAVRVHGDCMEPEIGDDWIVLVDTTASAYQGDVLVVARGNDLLIKRYTGKRPDGSLVLQADNPEYPGEIVIDPAAVWGVVIDAQKPIRRRRRRW